MEPVKTLSKVRASLLQGIRSFQKVWLPEKPWRYVFRRRIPRIPTACRYTWLSDEILLSSNVDDVGHATFNSINGEYMVVWEEHLGLPSAQVRAGRISRQGARLGETLTLAEQAELAAATGSVTVPRGFDDPFAAHDHLRNEFFVVWRWQNRPGAVFLDQGYGMRISAAGTRRSTPVLLAQSGRRASVAFSPRTREFLYLGNGNGAEVRQVVSAGGPAGDARAVSPRTVTTPVLYNPITNEYFFVGYSDSVTETTRLNARGEPVGLPVVISTQHAFVVSADVDPVIGTYLVAQFSGSEGLVVLAVNELGQPIAPAKHLDTGGTRPRVIKVVHVSSASLFLVAWDRDSHLCFSFFTSTGLAIGEAQELAGLGDGDIGLAVDPDRERVCVLYHKRHLNHLCARLMGCTL